MVGAQISLSVQERQVLFVCCQLEHEDRCEHLGPVINGQHIDIQKSKKNTKQKVMNFGEKKCSVWNYKCLMATQRVVPEGIQKCRCGGQSARDGDVGGEVICLQHCLRWTGSRTNLMGGRTAALIMGLSPTVLFSRSSDITVALL